MREERAMNDDAARRALGTLDDEPAPPVSTTLDEVVRRGRRRVLGQRVASVAGVVAVVAAIGTGAVLLRPGDTPDGVQVAISTTPAPRGAGELLPGWRFVSEQAPDGSSVKSCQYGTGGNLPPEPDIQLLPESVVVSAFRSVVEGVVGQVPAMVTSTWEANSPKISGPRGYVAVEVGMGDGNGQFQLEAVRYGGSPTQMADASVAAYGNCDPPARHVFADGTVLQLYPANDVNAEQPRQPLQIYQPGGRMYIVTSAGYGEADMVDIGGGASTVEGGRGRLPADDAHLAQIAVELVHKLG